ncbi:SMP-30/gluconolactonase/LRE family protein [Shewanella sp. 3_MG-2023]|uniref:SMP-30/gluconolactonase/LRE family protein n=1 Tax=Shewanella sp. 3_MG-2023 TaxID=3062635 RepID=UPI0026E39037|nr:SMP-30/gluconolactonase/LRE family protein [Shewanella sp. 3_MG-2023]MDO6776998.1 SMP-30/gluconolactonase/LRE family protein [Shewanella sp. 3_MG-2023]
MTKETLAVQQYDNRVNFVGESPLWHPLRSTLYWVDFPNNLLMGKNDNESIEYTFDEMVTAIGWIDELHLLIATATGLYQFNLESKQKSLMVHVEHELQSNRSNDGRADPWGGFWIGTMNTDAKADEGAFYRYYHGELRKVIPDLSIPNGVCFDLSRQRCYFTDSAKQQIYVIALDANTGWPIQDAVNATLFYDFSNTAVSPDGGIVDADGNLWVSLWDGGAVMCISPDGVELKRILVGTPRATCPAFGGDEAQLLFTTTAACGLEDEAISQVIHGATLLVMEKVNGVFEPAVKV